MRVYWPTIKWGYLSSDVHYCKVSDNPKHSLKEALDFISKWSVGALMPLRDLREAFILVLDDEDPDYERLVKVEWQWFINDIDKIQAEID